jgi:hypothetical protein
MVVSHAQVEFDRNFPIAHEVMIMAVQKWLRVELGLKFENHELSSQGSWTFQLAGFDSVGCVTVSMTIAEGESGAEIVVETPFFMGAERNRFRLLGSEKSTLEISTTMESQDSTRPEFDIPRLTDTFLNTLESVFGRQLISQGEPIQSIPWIVESDKESIARSPLATSSSSHGLPIVIIGNNATSPQRLNSMAADSFGVAHLVALSPELIPRNVSDFVLGVFWKDGSARPDYYSRRADWRAVYRQLVRGAVRRSDFESRWRDHLYRATSDHHSEQHFTILGDNQSLTLTPSDFVELSDRNSELEQKLIALEAELTDVRADSEGFLKHWEESEKKAVELKSMLRSQNYAALSKASGDANSVEIDLYVDLGSVSIDEELNDLVSQTGGAIVFTDNVARSWRDARKAGYSSPEKMANNLGKLCKFALDYKFLGGALGMPVADYAKNKFDLDIVNFDEKLPEKFFDFEGLRHNQEHHIRADDSRESFDFLGRIHFALDPTEKRIIVNHLGKKLYQNEKS